MSFEIAFTQGFKDGVARVPPALYPVIDRQIDWLEEDPFAKNPNAKRMKNVRQTFRMRIGKHVRMLYRVDAGQSRVVLFAIGQRESIYKRPQGHGPAMRSPDSGEIRAKLKGQTPGWPRSELKEIARPIAPAELLVEEVEHLSWIDEYELFLLNVPQSMWLPILEAGSLEGLQAAPIPAGVKTQIEDYWTNPSATQVEKLYSLAAGQDVAAIALQPLEQFLVALDPEQKDALAKLKADGPYLLKGSAGTGKSLVGLYHLRDLIISRAGAAMFDDAPARYGVITYTNTLVDASLELLRCITPASGHADIVCTTLDKLAYELAERALGLEPSALNTVGLSNWIDKRLLPTLPAGPAALVRNLGSPYIADEIEQAINGNGLHSADEYITLERKGRKKPLQTEERRNLWLVHEALQALLTRCKTQTFAQRRCLALDYLRNDRGYPRFAALFVDEAQDFPKVARQLCLELVRDPKRLVLAADTGQSIYTVPLNWRQCDTRFDFRRRRPIQLARSYRATREISRAIATLRNDPGDDDDQSTDAIPVFSGPRPRWIEASRDNHPQVVTEEVAKLVHDKDNPINAGQIAIIVRDAPRAEHFEAALKARGIGTALIKKFTPLQLQGHAVHIVTAHSCKGLGFPVVFVPDVDGSTYPERHEVAKAKDDKQREQIFDTEQRLLYVALSRASHRLFMVTDPAHPSPFAAKFERRADWS